MYVIDIDSRIVSLRTYLFSRSDNDDKITAIWLKVLLDLSEVLLGVMYIIKGTCAAD